MILINKSLKFQSQMIFKLINYEDLLYFEIVLNKKNIFINIIEI